MALRQHLEILVQDLRYAARGFRRSPSFTLAATLALALGIGAGTAVFSVVDRILFRSLPYQDAGRLVSFGMAAPIAPQEFMLGYDYSDWRDGQSPFESMGAWAGVGDCDINDANPVRVRCARIDSTFLTTLGVRPAAGRNFTRQEELPNAPKTALISWGLWRSRFAGNPGVVGRTMPLDGQPVTIAGVLPRDFELPTLESADIFVPQMLGDPDQRARRMAVLLFAIGRLKPGVTEAQAVAGLQPLFQKSLEAVTPSFRKDVTLRLRPLRDRQVQDARLASWILLGAVIAVLLIACANVANLLLARGTTREREVAVRAAMGAGRGRLVRQTLTESTLLALAGGAAGCGLAFALLRFFVVIAPEGIPRLHQAAVDTRVLLFTLAVSLVCGILFGLAPALQTPRAEALAGWRTRGSRRHLFRHTLVAVQICVSMILLTGASLLLRSLWNLQNQPLGMRTDSVIAASVTLGRASYADPARRLAFFEEMETRLGRIPGVTSSALADSLPPSGNPRGAMLYAAIDVEGRPRYAAGTGGTVNWRAVTPEYFSTLGIPILRGRGFAEDDRDPKQNAIILSDSLARRMFPGEDPLGKRIRPGRQGEWQTVVGVAGNVRNSGLVEKENPEFYSVRKRVANGTALFATAIVRTGMHPQAMARWVRGEIASLDPALPVTVETLDQRIGKLAERPRFNAVLLGIFAGMGLLLAAVGLYGVISFLVAQRTAEIGIRMALGATPRAVARLVLAEAASWTAAGALFGAIGSLFAVRLLERMLFQVRARDPWAFATATALLGCVAMAAAWFPSRRAARVDPVTALRQE